MDCPGKIWAARRAFSCKKVSPRLAFLFLLLASPLLLLAQQPARTGRQVDIDFATTWTYTQLRGKTVQKLIGDVQLHQDSVYMYCDSAIIEDRTRVFASGNVIIQQGDTAVIFADSLVYHSETREADLFGNVVLENGDQRLFTNRLHYDLNTKVATYLSGAVLTNGQSRLSSRRGYYFVEQNEVYFRDNVEVINPEFSMKADTLKFNTALRRAFFLGPTIISTGESKIFTEGGFYDTEVNFAEFNKNAQFLRGDQKATADTIRYDGRFGLYTLQGDAWFEEGERRATADLIQYDEKADKTFLKGNAYLRDENQEVNAEEIIYDAQKKSYVTRGRSRISDPPQILEADQVDFDEDSGLGIAEGNVSWQDTSAQLSIVCATAAYNRESGFLKASGGRANRPLLLSILEGDTLYMTADTLYSLRVDPDSLNTDSSRLLLAFKDVRIFKSDLQAICDSMSYSTVDSIFRFFRAPFIWSDTTQFSADTIHMQLRDNKIDRIFLYSNAFIINSPDERFFNQIKGRYIEAIFEEDELRVMDVSGNAESIYYARDDAGAYIGVNKTACSDMVLYFGNNQIERIKFLAEPKSKMDPMRQADHNTMRMEGFNWDDIQPCRPTDLDALFAPVCPRTMPAPPPLPRPTGPRPGALTQEALRESGSEN